METFLLSYVSYVANIFFCLKVKRKAKVRVFSLLHVKRDEVLRDFFLITATLKCFHRITQR